MKYHYKPTRSYFVLHYYSTPKQKSSSLINNHPINQYGSAYSKPHKIQEKYLRCTGTRHFSIMLRFLSITFVGTTARVRFVLVGDQAETRPRLLHDDRRPSLKRGHVDVFVMAVPRKLGHLTHIRYRVLEPPQNS